LIAANYVSAERVRCRTHIVCEHVKILGEIAGSGRQMGAQRTVMTRPWCQPALCRASLIWHGDQVSNALTRGLICQNEKSHCDSMQQPNLARLANYLCRLDFCTPLGSAKKSAGAQPLQNQILAFP
jgi:hypothetical protein